MELNEISGLIVDAAINVHKNLGPGLLENIYEEALCYELEKRRLEYSTQTAIKVPYEDIVLKSQYRLDILVENKIILELKCVDRLLPIHDAQLLTYLKISNKKLGLLLNFNAPLMKDGIKRIIL